MTRIIFVGIHNKPGFEPLDSRTKSGKIIDEVIKGLPDFECIKSNLFDLDHIPDNPSDIQFWVEDWFDRIGLGTKDIVVLLGEDVRTHLRAYTPRPAITVPHPASRRIKREEYIKDLIYKILNHEQH